ncbi:hypothetical protein [Streptomyces europaeiscabiei]|uniref:hypothetical protein n=1 Tax=Streptomyces europaeiscabiei TaxID=146819 RepID=UPI002E27FB21|nr:hypothetical protein [Streptomyces europaeiscabiei]
MGAQAREDGAASGSEKSSATGSEETPATGAVRIGDDGRVEHDDGTERQAQDPVPAGEQAAAVTLADATVADMRAVARWTIMDTGTGTGTATAAVGGPLLGGFPPAVIGRSTASATSRRPPTDWPWRWSVRRHPRHPAAILRPARHPPHPARNTTAPGPSHRRTGRR